MSLPKLAQNNCYMVLHNSIQQSPGSHFAVVDSGTSMHILQYRLFASNLKEDHTAVSGFSGNTSRATHKGDFNCIVRAQNGRLIHLVDPSSTLIIPDSHRNLYSVRHAQHAGHTVILGTHAGLLPYHDSDLFVPFIEDKNTGLWLLPLLPPPTAHNGVYPIYNAIEGSEDREDSIELQQNIIQENAEQPFQQQVASTPATFQQDRTNLLNDHHRLGHISMKRARSLNIDGIQQPPSKMPKIKCPVCIASKAKRHKKPVASTAETRTASGPWQDIYSDLSGKMRTPSITGYYYFAVFVCAWSGAKHCEFIARKNHFIDAYRRFLATTGIKPLYIRTLRTDQGGEYINHRMKALLEDHLTNHVVCAKDEHYSVGAAETAVNNLRHSARAMMLHGNVPKRFWHFAIAHATYLHNVISPSRADKSKTIFELLFDKKADLTQVPPYGCFATIYKNRRTLQDQSLDLPSDQGIFIGIATHNKVLGYCISDGSKIIVTRQNLAFDPHLYPFHEKPLSAPAWQTFHNLTQAAAQGSTQQPASSSTQLQAPEYASSESDLDDLPCSSNEAISDINNQEEPQESLSSESDKDSDDESTPAPRVSARPKRPTVSFKSRLENPTEVKKSGLLKRYALDKSYSEERNTLLNMSITKRFPGHGSFKGTITEYHPASDNYSVSYQNGDTEVMSHSNVLKFVPDARAAPDVTNWMKACDVEMDKLRSLGCWEVLPRSSLPPHILIMKSRWTFRYKTNELGNLKDVSHRSRFVAKGYSQVQGIQYFENYAPVASFITLRLLFALTSLPQFKVLQYDVSVAFIQSKLDPNHPPLYCECAEGYEDRRKFVYRLHRHLYGMKDSPRGWGQLFASVCIDFGLTRLKSDECVFVRFVNNSKQNKHYSPPNLANISEATSFVPERDRIYPDCPHATAILIIASYVDDNLAFTNCDSLAAAFETHCNLKFPMNGEGPVNWYLSVKYDRDPVTGAVSAHQHLYIDKLLKKWGMEQCNSLPTPFPQKADDTVKELAQPVDILDVKLVKEYQALVGSFLYLQVHTFPEISWAVSVLSKYMLRPGLTHLVVAKKLLRYLKGRKHITLRWCAQDCTGAYLPGIIYGYADASFADTIPYRHSSVGYVFLLNGAAISWRASRTSLIVLNAAEAELYSLSSATQEAIYLRKVCLELGFLQTNPTIMYEDCQAAVALSKENRFRNRSKHISLRWSFVVERQSLAINDITVVGISRTGMLADIFCSPRPASSFIPFRNTILGHPQMPIVLPPTEQRDASYSILVHASSEYPTARYRAHPSIEIL